MPDIIEVIYKRGRLIVTLTIVATLLALVICLLLPKQYLAVATALPANSANADKGRLFNSNIESLYPELGSPDELDRIEGTTQLDTLFIAVADSFDLTAHYGVDKNAAGAAYKAAQLLRKKSDIRRSAYGELKIKVWDGDAAMAARLANALLTKLNELHQHVQSKNNAMVLGMLQSQAKAKQKKLDTLQTYVNNIQRTAPNSNEIIVNNSTGDQQITNPEVLMSNYTIQKEQLNELLKITSQYELASSIKPNVLIPVEYARAALQPDKPRTLQITLFAFGASLLFAILLALFAESRSGKL